ncbi:TPA: hypothetical protein NHR87_005898 [Pseudomonas aeruginosa]|nr:hypothetical protein [Pseudomonas aeruginosa]HCE7128567.1 hypothetical protein [Pseudomonas aeruginosa]HCE7188098.1 hypothetical protein [Pseudomonas aeruginosa]HCE7339663.1 hypothetical protein [Pseudomonas aeruginosa]HCE7451570.1 hypothetical protein [Pseudomonas aeruginosa]
MLSSDEQADLAAALVATAETLGQEMSANAAKLMAKDLADYPGDAIRSALQACRRELTGKLTLAAILQRVQAVDGRPEPNEAWALALEASDERATVVLTPEIQEALTIAAPILEARDKVGARMAFISAYERAVSRSRREALPVEWRVSLGHDESGRLAGIQKAAALNRLPASEVARLEGTVVLNLPAPTDAGQAISGLLTGNAPAEVTKAPKGFAENMAKLKASLAAHRAQREQKEKDEAARRRADLNERINRHNEAIQQLQESRS